MFPVGIVVALLPEAACLAARPRAGEILALAPGYLLHVSGIGPARAEQAAEQLADRGAGALMSIGTAGALRAGLRAGDLLLPERILTAADALSVDARWRGRIAACFAKLGVDVRPGDLAESDRVLATPAEKTAFGTLRGAAAVDMESAAVLRVAARRGLPAVVARVILDAVDLELPPYLLHRSDALGRAHLPGVLIDLLRAPGSLPALLRTGRAFQRAAGTLRRVGQALGDLHPGHDAPGGAR